MFTASEYTALNNHMPLGSMPPGILEAVYMSSPDPLLGVEIQRLAEAQDSAPVHKFLL